MLYSGTSFFKAHVGEEWMDDDIVLWIAHYGKPPGKPGYLSPRVAIHQYSQTGKVNGIAGDCDLNSAIWSLDRLVVGASGKEDEMTADEVRAVVRDELVNIARRDDVGWARSQILAALGVAEPEAAPLIPPDGSRTVTEHLQDIKNLLVALIANQPKQ